MKRRDILLGLICWLLVLFTAACSDDLGGNTNAPSSSSNLRLLVPTILSADGNSQSDNSSNNTTYNATVNECQINDLKLYAFPIDDNGNATGDNAIMEQLPAPIASNMLDEHVATYQLRINPGKYHVYTIANMSEALAGKTFSNESDLKAMVLNYYDGISANLPIATNIPMIYEPKDENGNTLVTNVPVAGEKYTTVAANLKFTCVKVKLNLLFDPNAEGSSFSGKGLSIENIIAQQLSPSTTLGWNGKFTQAASDISSEYATGFSTSLHQASSEANAQGGYYKDGEWIENAANATVNDKDVISINENATPTAAPQNTAAKWLFQGTYYLPERYIADAAKQSYLNISGKVNGNNATQYTIKLGHRQDENSTTEVPTFPRGTYYEITGKPKSLGNIALDCQVSIKPWTPVQIDADFNHTTLWVSKTQASVTSTTADSINYESNVILGNDCFGCDNQIETSDKKKKDIIVLTKLDAANKKIIFNINKDIKFSDYKGTYQGTAKVWVKAGNIKKYLDVKYDAAPYFDVNPQEVTIYWGSDNNTKVVQFKTNLGGLAFTNSVTSSTVGNSTIKASCENPDTYDGTFEIEATTDPVTTTVHYLTVQPKESAEGFNFVKKIKVTVKPAVGNYRINFRAINDRTYYSGSGNTTGNYEGTPEENKKETYDNKEGNTNWADGWFENTWYKDNRIYVPQTNNHFIYVYTQIGETTGSTIDSPAWYFTKSNEWPGDGMTADNTNVGWYYTDFQEGLMSTGHNAFASDSRKIKPGETLIMFSNNTNQNKGYTLHRCPHHLEPGIPLFDYEDREGWIVYDPTSDPTWHVYDDMPTIENVSFTIYTKFQTYGWFKVYGVANGKNGNDNNTERESFTIYDTNGSSWSCNNVDGTWYKTVITLKAIKGDHEKDIRIKTDNKTTGGGSILLFNGNSYEKNGDVGYYDDAGSWHSGKPYESIN